MNTYRVKRSSALINTSGEWNSPAWKDIEALSISNYLKQSSDHLPVTLVKVLFDDMSIHVLFKVSDRYVRCTRTEYQGDVWNDSCVEWFVKPKPDKGYFNFEVNCGGTLHVHYVEDPTRINGALKKSMPLPWESGKKVEISHSLPTTVEPEITEPVEWTLQLTVPRIVFEPFIGPIGPLSGQTWRANFNKCADQTSHPAWATWNPVSELNFHRPQEFGEIVFE
jgi:hypothetical protein